MKTEEENFTMKINFGSIEPKTVYKFENGRMVCYSYAIHRDQSGNITKITDQEPISSIGYDNGKPFTKKDYNELMRL